ncbi:cytochrome P450 [Aspergillus saccharolyticus JOP 1030-1]|uniref:Cytochrome P450 n=1 Tax=Aspergillus saccharolyticus JOP 1030-1 TaxID=1450539 RepID=A0A318Z7M4_9EURO|nr:cytochrome P450 [Aspergillus saccharolyticus JOP 1030-1]PYH42434.1 cytochrome P450 [Aspergillus saccharolyticus JOP 1030-1]
MTWTIYLSLAVAAGILCHSLISSRILRRQRDLSHIPLVRFHHDDTQASYIARTREIMHQGYVEYNKKGMAFRIRNPVDEGSPQVIMAKRYLDEVKNASEEQLSFPLYSIQAFLLKYSGSVLPSAAATHVTRIDLNKNLGELVEPMREECLDTLRVVIPESKDWTLLKPWDTFVPLISRMTGRVLVGPTLCSNPEWIQLTIANTAGIMKSAMEIRASYSARWQWLAPWTYRGRNDLRKLRKRATELIEPLYRERLAGKQPADPEQKHRDAVQWLIEGHQTETEKGITSAEIADGLLFLYMAGIHSTSATVVSIMYDLLAHPEVIPELLEEIHQVQTESPQWSKQSLAKLRKLDSFMKESQRLHPAGFVTVQRSTVRPYTFQDGLQLPANTFLMFPTYEFTHDGETYPNPEQFDPWRFYRMRTEGDATKFHFATVSNDSTNFGAGFHACPGRFFVAHELKIILTELLLQYDFKFAEGTARPPDHYHDFTVIPNQQAQLLVRKRQERKQ